MMSKIHTRRGGFTLIELMIVVAIIGILAAIAIPNFLKFQLKAKTSEGKTNLAAIRTAEESVFAEYGAYVSADTSPAGPAGQQQGPFADTGAAGMNFDGLGWTPEGDVYFVYGVAANADGRGLHGQRRCRHRRRRGAPDLGLPQGRLGRGDCRRRTRATASAPSRASRTRTLAPASPRSAAACSSPRVER